MTQNKMLNQTNKVKKSDALVNQDKSITILLNEDKTSALSQEQLFRKVYRHLREIAFMRLNSERKCSTYNVTSLVDEAFLRITSSGDYQWQNRRQFYASVATTMKRILIENARHNLKKGRENKFSSVEFEEEFHLDQTTSQQVINLNEALEQLNQKRPELAELVQLKFYVGLEIAEIAEVMECSRRSVDRKWSLAKAWLTTALAD